MCMCGVHVHVHVWCACACACVVRMCIMCGVPCAWSLGSGLEPPTGAHMLPLVDGAVTAAALSTARVSRGGWVGEQRWMGG